jgi:hypothetical protein
VHIQVTDGAIVMELQRWLRLQLQGDPEGERGLYYLIAHSVSTWDQYQQLAGHIRAFETVLNQIEHIASSHGTGLEEKVVFRSGMN